MESNPYKSPLTETSLVPGVQPEGERLPGWYKWLSAILGAGMTFVGTAMATFLVGFIIVVVIDSARPVQDLGDVVSSRTMPGTYLIFALSVGVGLFMSVRSVLHTLKLFGANGQVGERQSTQ